jgi:hypothetical protein
MAKAVLNTNLLQYTDLRTGMTSGTFTINLVDAALPVICIILWWIPWRRTQLLTTQVPVTIDSMQSKTTLCPEDLRSVYQSAFMSAGTGNDFIPFEEVISESYAAKLTLAVEDYLIKGATELPVYLELVLKRKSLVLTELLFLLQQLLGL